MKDATDRDSHWYALHKLKCLLLSVGVDNGHPAVRELVLLIVNLR